MMYLRCVFFDLVLVGLVIHLYITPLDDPTS